MKGVDRFTARVGANIRESMGATPDGRRAAGGPLPDAAGGASPRHEGVTRPRDAWAIEVDRLAPDPDQPRKEFDEESLGMLAESLKTRGQLQPIRVRWDGSHADGQGGPPGRWVIVSGERRWRAAKLAGLATLAAVEAKGEPTPRDVRIDQLVENCLREDLKPIEQARAFKELMDDGGYSGRQLARLLNVSHVTVNNALNLLDLPAAVQDQVERGDLPASTAAEVAKAGDPATQVRVARAAVEGGLSRADVADFVQSIKARKPAPAARPAPVTLDLGDGRTVTVRWRRAGGPGLVATLRDAMKAAKGREEDGRAA